MSVAVGLLVLAALVVTGAAVSGSWLLVTVAAGLGVALGTAATRITHTELVESRVSAGRDRAGVAQAYNELADRRTSEHEDHVAAVASRLAEREQCLDELEEALALSQRRAASSTRRHHAEGRRATDLQRRLTEAEERSVAAALRVTELEQEVLGLRGELAAVTAAWRAASHERRHA